MENYKLGMTLKKLVSYAIFLAFGSKPSAFAIHFPLEALALASSASSVQLPIANTVLEQSNASTTVKKKAKKKTSATVSTSPIKKRTYFDRTDPKSVLEGLRDRMYVPDPFLRECSVASERQI